MPDRHEPKEPIPRSIVFRHVIEIVVEDVEGTGYCSDLAYLKQEAERSSGRAMAEVRSALEAGKGQAGMKPLQRFVRGRTTTTHVEYQW